jgi:hypothetical protein
LNYGGLFKALQTFYPEHPCDNSRFTILQRGHWSDISNQKKRIEEIARELGIKELDDWYAVSKVEVSKRAPFIQNLYSTLKDIYPNHNWDELRFGIPRGYWNNMDNLRKRFEEVAKELNVKQLDDWYKVSRIRVYKRISVLRDHPGGLFTALKAVYPQHNWDVLKFEFVPRGIWKKPNEQFLKNHLLELVDEETQH